MDLSTTKSFTHKAKDYTSFYNQDGEPRVNIEGVVEIAGGTDINVESTGPISDPSFYIGKSSTMIGGDFDVAYTAATQLTFSNYPAAITAFTADDIELVRHFNAAGDVVATYHRDDARMTLVADVLTVTGATFGATDTFLVATNVVATGGYDETLDLIKVQEQYPLNHEYVEASIADTTNVATGTYYPASTGLAFGAYKNLSITGKLIDGAGETTTLSWEVSNDEDTAAADWTPCYAYESVTDSTVLSVSATNETKLYAVDFDDFNYRYIRFKIVTSASTNTVIIKIRRSY
jgi:hypothetical protein